MESVNLWLNSHRSLILCDILINLIRYGISLYDNWRISKVYDLFTTGHINNAFISLGSSTFFTHNKIIKIKSFIGNWVYCRIHFMVTLRRTLDRTHMALSPRLAQRGFKSQQSTFWKKVERSDFPKFWNREKVIEQNWWTELVNIHIFNCVEFDKNHFSDSGDRTKVTFSVSGKFSF